MALEKNTAGKWTVFAFDVTTNLPVTGDAANITANVRIDGGAANAVDDTNPAEQEDGYYIFDITAAESSGDIVLIAPTSSTADVQVIGVPGVQYPVAPNTNAQAITVTGATAIDWANIENKGSTVDLSATSTNLVDTTTANSDMRGTNSAALATDLATAQTDLDTITGAAGAVLDSTATSAQLVDDFLDEVNTGATHNVNNSVGKQIRQAAATVFADGTLQSATSNGAVLAAGSSALDGFFTGAVILTTGGTGTDQSRVITAYDGGTLTVTVSPSWTTTPDVTTAYDIRPGAVHAETVNQGYADGAVYINTLAGNAGTSQDVNGTQENPSSNLADATTIASEIAPVPLKHFIQIKGSSVILAQTYTAFVFNGRGGTIALNEKDISLCTFISQNLSGIGIGSGRVFIRDCLLTGVSLNPSAINSSAFTGTFSCTGTGTYTLRNCTPQDAALPPTIDFGAAVLDTSMSLMNWDGPVIISNLGQAGTDILHITGSGDIVFDASCVGGVAEIHGSFSVTNNGSGIALTTVSNYNTTEVENAVWDATITKLVHNDPNTAGRYQRLGQTYISAEGDIADASATTTVFKTTLTEVDDFWNDHRLRFDSGALEGQTKPILSYSQTDGQITLDEPLTSAPANADEFVILSDHIHPITQIAAGVWNAIAAIPGQIAMSTTPTFGVLLGFLYKFTRNKTDQSSTTLQVYADDETTVDQKAAVSDVAGTATKGEIEVGP